MEPASGLSTYCRSCGGHIRMEKSATVPVRSPFMPLRITGSNDRDAPLTATATSFATDRNQARGLVREPPRQVVCFECEASHKVAKASTSTICPGCSTCIDLRDMEIKDRTNQRIRTRGNVVVEKKGALLGTSLHCGSLTVHGIVSGSIYASGDVHLKADGKLIGEVRCRRFILDKKCEVQCLQPVHAETVEIHGRVSGHFHASRSITLGRHASLTGSATAQAISVEPGAVLNGRIQIISR